MSGRDFQSSMGSAESDILYPSRGSCGNAVHAEHSAQRDCARSTSMHRSRGGPWMCRTDRGTSQGQPSDLTRQPEGYGLASSPASRPSDPR